MSVLASLLVRDQILPVDRVQEAIQEQVMRGGNLDTVLLELDLLSENQMNAYCAAVFGLLPATRDEVMQAPISSIRVLPREFAVRHRLVPVARTEDAVVLAVDRPLPQATLREISFELGLDPVQRIVCSVRIEAGLARHYDIEMTARMRHLNQRLLSVDAGAVPYVQPFEGVGKRSSLPPKKAVSGSYPRVESSIPAPVAIADTEPPPAVLPQIGSSVPAGTFRDSSPGEPPRRRSAPSGGFIDATRYSLPPRPPEVLGRAAVRGSGPSAPAVLDTESPGERSGPGSNWHPGPAPRSDIGLTSTAPPLAATDEPHRWASAPRPTESEASLPSIIVDVGDDVERLVADLRNADPDDERAILPLLSVGEGALPALAREFPGPLWFDRNEPHARVPRGRDLSPIARAFVTFGQRAVPYLIPLLSDEDADTRYYATILAAEFVHSDLVQPVGRRLFDVDPGVRSNAYRALTILYACEVEFNQLIERLRAAARDDRKLRPRVVSIEALGRLRDAGSLEFLISLLDDPEDEVIRVAHASLVRLSCQDFGTSKKKWASWLAKHGKRHRVEWLIDGLMHSDERLRRRAGDELEHLTREYFGYDPGLSKKAREAVQEKYRAWWQSIGFRMFIPASGRDSGQVRGR